MITRKASEANFIAACWAVKAHRQTGRKVSIRAVLKEYQVGSNAYRVLAGIEADTDLNDSVIESMRHDYRINNAVTHLYDRVRNEKTLKLF